MPEMNGAGIHSIKRVSPGTGHLRSERGFTFIELIIVLAIMGVLLTIAQPNLSNSVVRAKESVLKEDLFQMREALDQYYADNGKYPAALDDLVSQSDKTKSYLREIPVDPFTKAKDWITVSLEGEDAGIFDVHSASDLIGSDNTAYNTW